MNNVAVLPHTIMYYLQNQNIDRKVAKPAQQTGSTNADPSTEQTSAQHNQSQNIQLPTKSATATQEIGAPETASFTEPVGASLDDPLVNTPLGSTVINI